MQTRTVDDDATEVGGPPVAHKVPFSEIERLQPGLGTVVAVADRRQGRLSGPERCGLDAVAGAVPGVGAVRLPLSGGIRHQCRRHRAQPRTLRDRLDHLIGRAGGIPHRYYRQIEAHRAEHLGHCTRHCRVGGGRQPDHHRGAAHRHRRPGDRFQGRIRPIGGRIRRRLHPAE